MKVIIAGSRSISTYELVKETIEKSGFEITEIVSGHARGVDKLGERYAKENNIPVKLFIPDWEKDGKGAGFIRSSEMIDYADALIAIWDGQSRGTDYTITEALKRGLKVFVWNYRNLISINNFKKKGN